MTVPAADIGVEGLTRTERLFQAFERDLPVLLEQGVQGWCVYEYKEDSITRSLTGVPHQQAYQYAEGLAPGEYIVQGVDVDEPDYDSIQITER